MTNTHRSKKTLIFKWWICLRTACLASISYLWICLLWIWNNFQEYSWNIFYTQKSLGPALKDSEGSRNPSYFRCQLGNVSSCFSGWREARLLSCNEEGDFIIAIVSLASFCCFSFCFLSWERCDISHWWVRGKTWLLGWATPVFIALIWSFIQRALIRCFSTMSEWRRAPSVWLSIRKFIFSSTDVFR